MEEKTDKSEKGEKGKISTYFTKIMFVITTLSVEPIMMLDGLAYSVMIVAVENLQMDKICLVNLNYTKEICKDIPHHDDENIAVQQYFSYFGMYNGIIMAFLPLFFILFMGAWSDKYGRKIPLILATLGHFLFAFGYLLNSWISEWPVENLLVAALLDSLGGGLVSFLTSTNAYISDITSEETRTSRVGLANSLWYLGGPIGTLLGTVLYSYGGYVMVFSTSVIMYIINLIYSINLPESHGPFAKIKKPLKDTKRVVSIKKSVMSVKSVRVENNVPDPKNVTYGQMLKDLFNIRRIVDSFRSTFKRRDGNARAFILLLITCNLLRRLGRGAYMYLFTRKTLHWNSTNYGYWVTYKNLITSMGSLVAVPLLSTGLKMSDNFLAILGSISAVLDYCLYGLVSQERFYLIWIAPAAALLVNSCVIAIRAMLSKLVSGDELGKVSAVMGALDGVMPMAIFSLYTAVYSSTVHVFPGAQFFFGASANLLMVFIFMFIICINKSKSTDSEDDEKVKEMPEHVIEAVDPTAEEDDDILVLKSDTHKPLRQTMSNLSAVLVSGENFQIASPHIENEEEIRNIYKQSIKRQRISASVKVSSGDHECHKALAISQSLKQDIISKRSTKKRPQSVKLLENRARLADFHLRSVKKKNDEEESIESRRSNIPTIDEGNDNLGYVEDENRNADKS